MTVCTQRIKDTLTKMTKSQRNVADFILQNPMQSSFETIESIATNANTSTATVIRLTKQCGYPSFSEFQKDLQLELKDMSKPSIRFQSNQKLDSLTEGMYEKILSVNQENLVKTLSFIEIDIIEKAVERIKLAHHVYTYGERSSYGIATYLAYNIDRIRGNAEYAIYPSMNLTETIRRLKPNDVVILFNFPRYIKNVLRFAEEAKKRKAYVIVVTNSYSSPFTEFADIVLIANSSTLDFHNSMLGATLIAEIIISMLAFSEKQVVEENLSEMESILNKFDSHII